MNGAELVAEIIKLEETDFLACYPRNPLIEAAAALDVRPVICRQERVGVGIADGYSRVRGGRRNGVFAVQHGPGIENAFPGVAQAFSENVPLLVIPAGSPMPRQYQHPTFRAAEVFAPVTKWSAMAHNVDELPDLMRRAYQAMRSGKPGPVLVEIPKEVFEAEYHGRLDYSPVPHQRMGVDPQAIKKAATILLAAKNPLLWAGQGVRYANASDQLTALAEMLPAPVAATNPGKSAIADSHPLALGGSTRSRSKMFTEFMRRADVVLAVGSSLTSTSFGPGVPKDKTIIHATNDPSDINKDHRADCAIAGDATLVLEALIEEIGRQRGPSSNTSQTRLTLQAEISALKAQWLEEWKEQLDSNEIPINQYRVINEMLRTLDRDEVIITHDSGSPREQLLPFWETTKPNSYLGWGKSTQLGYGLGLIMGAKLAAPDKLCINVMGDSSFGMTGLDIETAARNGIGILTIVFNNGVMAAEREVLELATEKYGALTVGGNYTKLADALNVASRRVERPDEIAAALREAVRVTESGAPYLLEFMVKEGYQFSRYPLEGL